MISIEKISVATLLFASCFGCAASQESKQELMDRIEALHSSGNYDEAIRLATPLSADADPEIRFSVGYLYFERSQDIEQDSAKRASDLAEGLRLIESAADANLEQGASFLADAFKSGSYGYRESSTISECWRRVAHDAALASECRASM